MNIIGQKCAAASKIIRQGKVLKCDGDGCMTIEKYSFGEKKYLFVKKKG